MPVSSYHESAWLSWSLVTICEAAEEAMKAASGVTVDGGETKPRPIVEGLSLEMLCVLDLGMRGDAREGDRTTE
jgi:hypothetical protein